MKSAIATDAARALLFSSCLLACLTRPLVNQEPTTTTSFTKQVASQTVDKVDVLFDIDNSRSMGDKQRYLVNAIPDLIQRLVNPTCLDAQGVGHGPSNAGACPAGQTPEFRAVHDMHLGIVTSSLGMRLSDVAGGAVCDPALNADGDAGAFANVPSHNDDEGHLVGRSLDYADGGTSAAEGTVPDAVVSGYPMKAGFLAWFPGSGAPGTGPAPVTDAAVLGSDLSAMVQGAGVFGCGIESQLESWYRFLIQPDPYGSLAAGAHGAVWQGVDAEILRERKDFLRPDSLVAVIVLTDENDSEIDVRSIHGSGYSFMGSYFHPPKSTTACQTDPASPGCTSCQFDPSDPACAPPAGSTQPFAVYDQPNDWGFDDNLRHVHMKAKYGVDVQFPIQRYAIGLTSATVPDRSGEYPSGNGTYAGLQNKNCTNPLFADSLPDGSDTSAATLCNLPLGSRTSDLVYYAVIGGVPNELLHYKANDPNASALTDADWVRILGKGPASVTTDSAAPPSYDYTGIDPHMIEDYRDRTTAHYPFAVDTSVTTLTPSSAATNGTPLFSGREWTTDQEPANTDFTNGGHADYVDREFACIFPLPTERDCSQPYNQDACDCPVKSGVLSHDEVPPLCDDNDVTMQKYAKAYPTPRELQVARMLGTRGIVASLCPIHATDQGTAQSPDLYYGYRPAVASLIERLKSALGPQCVPPGLSTDADAGDPPCAALVTLPESFGGSCLHPTCDPSMGLSVPPAEVLATFCQNSKDPDKRSVCTLHQLTPEANASDFTNGSCDVESSDPGWCFVTGGTGCSQAIVFSNGALPSGSLAYLQCLQ